MHSDIGFAGLASAGFFDFKAFFFGADFITKIYQIQHELTISFRLKKICIIIMMSQRLPAKRVAWILPP
jgi:hypothetical protein